MKGIIQNIYIKENHGQPVTAVDSAMAEGGMGLVGDVSFGRSKRQVLFLERETLDEFGLVPGQIRENVTVIGLKLAGLPKGTVIEAGSAVFEVTGDCAPCQFIESIRPGLEAEMRGRRGTLCRVISSGSFAINDTVTVQLKEAEPA